jgi:hypothetical protein
MCLEKLCEKCYSMHKNSVNLIFHLVAIIIIIYALWSNSIEGILVGLLIAVIGHIIEELKKKKIKIKPNEARSKKSARRKRKKGALEMSIGTIVVMVIAITMLILGIVFVRSIMCKGIQMTDKLNEGVMNQISELFGSQEYGVKCMGENGEDLSFGTGGKRAFGCFIKVDKSSEYKIEVKKMASNDVSESELKEWVDFSGWEGTINPGGKGKNVVALMLDIPREAPATSLQITLESTLGSGSPETHTCYVNVKPTNFVTGTIC